MWRRCAVSPAAAASLVCMSRQNPQPLIWLARIFTNSCVVSGSPESVTTLPAEAKCFSSLPASGLVKTLSRASMVCSFCRCRWLHTYD